MRIAAGARVAIEQAIEVCVRASSPLTQGGGEQAASIAAGRIPPTERRLAAPSTLVFVDRYGEEVEAPPGRAPGADGYFPYRRDGAFQLTREAAAAFRALRAEALEQGYNLRINDGFRPDTEQARRHAHAERSGVEDASRRVARAGRSEHRTGQAIDLGARSRMPDGSPARRGGLEWAIANASRFGLNHYDGPAGERMHFVYNVR